MNSSALEQSTSQAAEENALSRDKIEKNEALVERLQAIEDELHSLRERLGELSDTRTIASRSRASR